ncbi:hypothetical protein NDA11_003245 [Ustilago hordei]|nr:hypothetical protein NDA15_007170 [Ustilago hordei]KAJ1590839.1 hypothetical protein NDA11_003245 [Ustilago hordei]KAJ1600883.1 hypothetical protein NDA14_004657 [Ustilago hordei]
MSTAPSTAAATAANHFRSSITSASPSSATGSLPTPTSPAICLVICAMLQASKALKEGPQKAAAAYQGSTLPDGKLSSNCHGPECSRSRRVTGSYGRSTGIEDLVDTSGEHGHSAVSMETMDSYGLTCKGGPGPYARRARHRPGTATRRTKLKEHADGYHSGA